MSNLYGIAFYVLAFGILGLALAVVSLRNIVHAALALIGTFFLLGWLYLMLNADLLWVAQLLIYAGAIPVLIVFAIMLTRRSMSDASNPESTGRIWAVPVALAVFVLLMGAMLPAHWHLGTWPKDMVGTTAVIGNELVNTYAVPFELVSVLLLIGLIGAVALARREEEG